MTIIQKGQCYGHKTNSKYYEIRSIVNGQVEFIYYDAKEDREHFAIRPLHEIERLVETGVLIRD